MSKTIALAIDTNTAGGAERVMTTLANYLVRRGHRVLFINSDSSSAFYELDARVTIVKMGIDRIQGRLGAPRRALAKYRFLRRWLRRERPDALLAFLIHMEVPATLAGLATGTPTFVSLRNDPWAHSKTDQRFRRYVCPHIAGMVLQSEAMRSFPDVARFPNVAVIPNPLPVGLTHHAEAVPAVRRNNRIVVVGRLAAQKNPLMIAHAFARVCTTHPTVELHFFGEGPLRDDLIREIAALGIEDRVVLHGVEPHPLERNRDARLFVMASHNEGFPNALAEALAFGIPSICTDFGSGVARELIEDGVNGWLVPVGDENALAKAMDHALSLGADETDALATRATAVFDRLNAEHVCALWERYLVGSPAEERTSEGQ